MKQRLIGAAVLLALGVIFIPMILDGSGNPVLREIPPIPQTLDTVEQKALVVPQAPPKQEDQPVLVRKPVAEQQTGEAEPAGEQPAARDKTSTAQAKPPARPAEPESKPVEEKPATKTKQTTAAVATAVSPAKISAWTVQVGSFNTNKKALALRSKLRGKGFKAYVEKIKRQKKVYYRVRVGPVLDRKDADKLLAKLKKQGQTGAYVVRHP